MSGSFVCVCVCVCVCVVVVVVMGGGGGVGKDTCELVWEGGGDSVVPQVRGNGTSGGGGGGAGHYAFTCFAMKMNP